LTAATSELGMESSSTEVRVMTRFRLPAVTCLLLSIVPFWLGGCAAPTAKSDITLKLPQPSPPLVDVVLLLDQSGSMNGPRGTDPQGLRVDAAR
jgi:hypothetical protein